MICFLPDDSQEYLSLDSVASLLRDAVDGSLSRQVKVGLVVVFVVVVCCCLMTFLSSVISCCCPCCCCFCTYPVGNQCFFVGVQQRLASVNFFLFMNAIE